jgi:hypothetical protein
MRTILSFLIGLVLGIGGMIWFYVNGGEISVAGHELGPPAKTVAATPAAGAAAPKGPQQPRMVVRDITDGSPSPSSPGASAPSPSTPSPSTSPSGTSPSAKSTPPSSTSAPTPAEGKSDDNSFVLISNSFLVIKLPRW